MKQLVAVLVAAMFAATSFAALAQDKGGKMEKKSDSTSSTKMDKKDGKKKDGKKKDGKKKSSDKMDKKSSMDKK
jgi:Ni/Co efflux regulator RcnB